MITFKCKMCGGDLHPEENATTCECEYCGSVQTIPTADNEKKGNLFNRANRLRMAAEYDKAAAVYTSITAEFPEEAEAYWGLCLCKYGIEYVEDPVTAKKIPTCHRTRSESIMDDPDFDQACENADAIAKKVYREEAKTIDRLQQDILSVVASESPYDVFICYKETGEDGGRTEDSVLAQDIYDALTAKGLKVFFARITLEDKLGQQYEPYIYAALHSAKVMLAVGTQFEYFDAVWVKNEWARFLDMMKEDRTKTLIPCYKDIEAYDVPRELKNLQAQDMGKLGWLQDLTRGVMKLCGKDEVYYSQSIVQHILEQYGSTSDTLLQRAFMFLEEGKWQEANDYAEKTLDIQPTNARAYLAKMMATLQVKKIELLGKLPPGKSFEEDENYLKTISYCDHDLKEILTQALRQIEQTRQDMIFRNTLEMLKKANTIEECEQVKETLITLRHIAGVDAAIIECDKKKEDIEQWAIMLGQRQRRIEELKKTILTIHQEQMYIDEVISKVEHYSIERKRAFEETESLKREISESKDRLFALKGIFNLSKKRQLEFEIKENEGELEKKQKGLSRIVDEEQEAKALLSMERKHQSELPDINEVIYELAGLYQQVGDFEMAAKAYLKIQNYADVAEILSSDLYKGIKASLFSIESIIEFGKYPQTSRKDNSPMQWIVIQNTGNTVMLISKYAIDCVPYHNQRSEVTWEECSLRRWLNSEFLNNAFNHEEQDKIQKIKVIADRNPKNKTNPGNDTFDKVFILSNKEVERLFLDFYGLRKCKPTEYAKGKGAREGNEGNVWWWLRSPGAFNVFASCVSVDGSIYDDGFIVNDSAPLVRPVIVIRV